MRKKIINGTLDTGIIPKGSWIELESTATVEMTSEDPAFPIESALLSQGRQGWRAAEAGVQSIRIIFDQPQSLRRISLVFVEREVERTQEFRVSWSPDRGKSFREIVRQQWNFSSPDATQEAENYEVQLSNVTLLELAIDPDKQNRKARASLQSLRLA